MSRQAEMETKKKPMTMDKEAETAAHMSHTLTTAETHYEAHSALELKTTS